MVWRLAWRNIRASFRDYAIYFVTIAIGVALFYVFGSLGAQSSLITATPQQQAELDKVAQTMKFATIGVAFVLGCLVVYANQFMMRRRKREFGVYLSLGFGTKPLVGLVFFESIIVGAVSLVAGLIAGVAASQGFARLTANLVGADVFESGFVFAPAAFLQTIAAFAVIYAVVICFNALIVSRMKLIDMLRAGSDIKPPATKRAWLYIAACVVGIALVVWAYVLFYSGEMSDFASMEFIKPAAALILGTLLFFAGFGSVAYIALRGARPLYYRGIVPFTAAQIASRIKSAFAALFVVCMLLFAAIATFGTAMGLIKAYCGDLDEIAPFSASLRTDIIDPLAQAMSGNFGNPTGASRAAAMKSANSADFELAEKYDFDLAAAIKANTTGWDALVGESCQVDMYELEGITYQELLDNKASVLSLNANNGEGEGGATGSQTGGGTDGGSQTGGGTDGGSQTGGGTDGGSQAGGDAGSSAASTGQMGPYVDEENEGDDAALARASLARANVRVVSVEQLNRVAALSGQTPINAREGTFTIVNNLPYSSLTATEIAFGTSSIEIAGTTYTVSRDISRIQPYTCATTDAALLVALPQNAIDALRAAGYIPHLSVLNIDYKQGIGQTQGDAMLKELIATFPGVKSVDGTEVLFDTPTDLVWPISIMYPKTDMIANAGGTRLLTTYLALYIGVALLIVTGAVLAIHQLTSAVDSRERYRMLYKLGCDTRRLSRSIFVQCAIFFLVPLALAIAHACAVIAMISHSLFAGIGVSVSDVVAATICATAAAYLLYMFATYAACRRFVIKETINDNK